MRRFGPPSKSTRGTRRAEVKGPGAGRWRGRLRYQAEAVQVDRLDTVIIEGDTGDSGQVDGIGYIATIGPILLASPQGTGEIDLHDVGARFQAKPILMPLAVGCVLVLQLETDSHGLGGRIVHGEAQRSVGLPVVGPQFRDRCHCLGATAGWQRGSQIPAEAWLSLRRPPTLSEE